ncbi:MAG: DNA repair protein RecN [Cyanothece sp. SIO1E1]|nr:DNA repair protein RecN [Cyanothece sp. SIO1E1]
MLVSLRIENFALIDRLELDFGAGLNVLTGETGAGKSIILDAIDAVLGSKLTQRAIRSGADRAVVEATFNLNAALEAWLTTQEIEKLDDTVLVCTRELVAGRGNVRSRSRLNGVLVNKQQIESLRDRLVEITAQGQTMQLGDPVLQRTWLDGFGGPELLAPTQAAAQAYEATRQTRQALEQRRQTEQHRLQQRDLFEYQARELSAANLDQPDELEQLEQERQRLSHSVELQQQSYQVYQALYQNDSGAEACADLLGKAEATLSDMLTYDPHLQPILELVVAAMAQVEEAGRQINTYGDGLETDPEQLQVIEQRLIQLKQICRKYGPTLAEVIAYYEKIQTELVALDGEGQSIEALEKADQAQQAMLMQTCSQLTQLRQAAARKLEAKLVQELKPLAMEKVQFQVEITPCTPTAAGADQITFLFSPNPGEPLHPLTEIASGGEMSRFLLALKACFSTVDWVDTLIFDEIDVGVSGRVAQAIAEKLHQLSRQHQVLCVTHQPIVAAMADAHFRVGKQVVDQPKVATTDTATTDKDENGKRQKNAVNSATAPNATATEAVRTVVRVTALNQHQQREELAQLAGGQSDQEAIAFAESLLAQAEKIRQIQFSGVAVTAKSKSSGKSKRRASRSGTRK